MNNSTLAANDCLIASSVKSFGAQVVTQNTKDFNAIVDIIKVEVQIVRLQ